jgi:hypothetical protein
MFKIILIVTTFGVGGHTTRVPLDSLYAKPFPTFEACIEVIKSDNFNDEVSAISHAVAVEGHNNMVSSECVPVLDGNGNSAAPEGDNRG